MRKRIITTLGFVFFGVFILINGLISQSLADEIKIKIPISTVTVLEDNEGNAKYSGDNVQYLTQSGEPMIPYQVIKVLLPPDADLNTVSGKVDSAQVEELTGEWDVRPKPPETTWDGKKVITVWPKGKTIVNGYDINIYEKNALFPEILIGTITAGQTRRWRMVDIPIALYQFNPVAKKLLRLVEGELTIEFSIDPTAISVLKEKIDIPDRIGEDSVKKLTVNFNEVSPTYEKLFPQALTPLQISRYVIITTNIIKSGSGELQNFVTSKVMRGFTVEVVTEDAWGGGTGDTAAENIRDWLCNNYENKNIEYVLLIGNPNPNSGDVPMKMLWPRSDATEYRESPSDYYYADLTGNWDLDSDGLYGERYGDFGSGGVDRNWDVLVGRIPYYGNMNDLDAILAKIIAYENETSNEAVWRQNVLLPMKPVDSNTPGYHLGEAIKNDIVVPKDNWDYHRVYDEDYGLTPSPETYPCTYDNVTDAWNSSQFGAIFWFTHGWSRGASSIMDLSHAATLDDSYPGFTFQGSCHNSYPEVTDNLSYSLLQNGCIGTIGATRVSWYYPGATHFEGTSGITGMAYGYSKRLIEDELDSGHALYELKQELMGVLWMNLTVFNIYGDPSTGLFTFTEFKGLQNGDFEQGVADTVFYWTPDVWKPAESIMVWGPFGEGYQGSRSVSIEHTEENDSRWIQAVSGLLPGREYRLSGWIKGQDIVNMTGGIGANLCLFGTWEHTPGISGTFDWTEVSMVFTAPANGVAVIGCRLGYWGNTTTGKVWFDNISLVTQSSFTAIPPCRIVDTRKTSAGIIDAGTERDFHVYGSGGIISDQGGDPDGCPSPLGQPLAAHINMVAVNPTGKGNLQAFPLGADPGAGLSVNYNAIDTNLANAGTVKTVTGSGEDITVASNFFSVHTAIDVLGYYYPDGDLLYTAVKPCRIVDTRKTSAGIIGASTQRNFRVYGSGGTMSAQGGNSAGCSSPLGQPLAAHINMVAVNPTGKGNLQAFPVDAGTGAGLSVNYNTIDTNLANAGTVKTVTGSGADITVASNFSSAHTAIDVLGYYYSDGDLFYTAVKPCRIVDTRKMSAGIIGVSTQRNFHVYGSGGTMSAQGGNSAGCSSPLGQPLAAHINMVAVNPTGKGNLQAFPVDAGPGAGLSVNYNTIDTNLANAGTVKTVTGSGPDITVASNFSSAHTVIDVLGYYYSAP